MKHILLIDPLSALDIKKDSSLLLALALQEKGVETYLMFSSELCLDTSSKAQDKLNTFEGSYNKETFQVESFEVTGTKTSTSIRNGDVLHMRKDPPFDMSYLQVLWILEFYKKKGVVVLNDPSSISAHNEKILAYSHSESFPTYIGSDPEVFLRRCQEWKGLGHKSVVLKPLNLFQGKGIQKISIEESLGPAEKAFRSILSSDKQELFVAQPFLSQIYEGEVRALYFYGKELASIKKYPKEGGFLTNVAQGGSYMPHTLTSKERVLCEEISKKLLDIGVPWVAFDLIDGRPSEVNITCPGLLVEVSKASKKNLALEIVYMLTERNS